MRLQPNFQTIYYIATIFASCLIPFGVRAPQPAGFSETIDIPSSEVTKPQAAPGERLTTRNGCFPKIVVLYPQIIHFNGGFPLWTHPTIGGTPIFGNTQIDKWWEKGYEVGKWVSTPSPQQQKVCASPATKIEYLHFRHEFASASCLRPQGIVGCTPTPILEIPIKIPWVHVR